MTARIRISKLVFAAIAAAAILGITVNSASANRLSMSEQGLEFIWTAWEFEVSGNSIRCPITLLGSFANATMAKRPGKVGVINHAVIRGGSGAGECTGGQLMLLTTTLPWDVNYVSFAGTLPNISSLSFNIIGFSFQMSIAGISCLARTETGQPFQGISPVSGGTVNSFRANERSGITTSGGFFCSLAGAAHFKGTATVTNLAQTDSIAVSLI